MDQFDIIAFDLDNTLSPSKSAIESENAELICRLLEKKKVVVISGATWTQFDKQFLSHLPCISNPALIEKLSILPTEGASFYEFRDGGWSCVYKVELSPSERKSIFVAFDTAFAETGFVQDAKIYGTLIEDRGSQVTFSGLGSDAPFELKKGWDVDKAKRSRLVTVLQRELPDFWVDFGGSTSIDIVKKGIDKAYGVKQLVSHLNSSLDRIAYVGDTLFPGGNDSSVIPLGIRCFPVKDPGETGKLIHTFLGDVS